MRSVNLLFCMAFLTPSLSWSANTFNLKCPAQAAVGAISAPSGWSIGYGQYFLESSAYMPNSSVLGCNYPTATNFSGNLFGSAPSGATCTVNTDRRSFSCTGNKTDNCPARTVIGYWSPMPTGWAGSGGGNSSGHGTAASKWTYGNGSGLGCYCSGWAGVPFQSLPVGMSCSLAADRKSFTCSSPFTRSGSPPRPPETTRLGPTRRMSTSLAPEHAT
jgi:hypothetical protein